MLQFWLVYKDYLLLDGVGIFNIMLGVQYVADSCSLRLLAEVQSHPFSLGNTHNMKRRALTPTNKTVLAFPPALTSPFRVSVASHYMLNLISISSGAAQGHEGLSRKAVLMSHCTALVELIAVGDREGCTGACWSHHRATDA